MIDIKSPQEIYADEDKEKAEAEAIRQKYESTPVMDMLASHVHDAWHRARANRHEVHERLESCLLRRRGEYSSDELAKIKGAGSLSTIYMQVTGAKCRALKAWLADLFAPAGDRPFELEPTAKPDLPPEILKEMIDTAMSSVMNGVDQEMATELLKKHKDRLVEDATKETKLRMSKMADVIEDNLQEGDFDEQFNQFLDDFVTYPTAFMRTMEFKNIDTLQWVDDYGTPMPMKGKKIIPTVRRISPFRAYPSPVAGSSIANDWFIEHREFRAADLVAMRDAPGYRTEAILHVLNQYAVGGLRDWIWRDNEAIINGRYSTTGSEGIIDGLEWVGKIYGQQLIDYGMSGISDPQDVYSVSITVIGNYVIRALKNIDPSGKPDVASASWESIPGSFWGKALPEAMADQQDACNGAARSLMNNMAIASGPQVYIDTAQMDDGANKSQLTPWKIWYGDTQEASEGSRPPIQFFQPSSISDQLMTIYERFVRYADDICGLPSYAVGSDSGAGAAKTASGLTMLMNAASKQIKNAVRTIDRRVIEQIVEKQYNYLMMTHEDNTIKGDAVPHAKGSDGLIQKEQSAMRQQEITAMTMNPLDQQIIGTSGRLEQLKQIYKSLDIDSSGILPKPEELAQREAQQPIPQQ